jgi:hypothetical protein
MRKAIPISVLPVLAGLLVVQVGCSKKDDTVTPPPPECAIAMTFPQGGESYYTGSQVSIRWTQTTGGNVKIDLLKGGAPAGTIAASTVNTGFYPWLSSSTFGQVSGDDYTVRVSHLTDTGCADTGLPFELIDVSNCFIKFPWTAKDSIPDLVADGAHTFEITWNSGNTAGFVDLELWWEPFAQTGDLVAVIAENLADTGSYTWLVDSYNWGSDEGFRFKIKDGQFNDCADTSVRFNLTDDVICSIDILGINGGLEYAQGEVIPLTFGLENSTGVVKLKLYSGNIPVNAAPLYGVITESFDTQNGTATFDWTVSDLDHGGPVFNRFNIRAFDLGDDYCVGQSADFAIGQ